MTKNKNNDPSVNTLNTNPLENRVNPPSKVKRLLASGAAAAALISMGVAANGRSEQDGRQAKTEAVADKGAPTTTTTKATTTTTEALVTTTTLESPAANPVEPSAAAEKPVPAELPQTQTTPEVDPTLEAKMLVQAAAQAFGDSILNLSRTPSDRVTANMGTSSEVPFTEVSVNVAAGLGEGLSGTDATYQLSARFEKGADGQPDPAKVTSVSIVTRVNNSSNNPNQTPKSYVSYQFNMDKQPDGHWSAFAALGHEEGIYQQTAVISTDNRDTAARNQYSAMLNQAQSIFAAGKSGQPLSRVDGLAISL